MALSRQLLIHQALYQLGITPVTETPAPEDYDIGLNSYLQAHALLQSDDLLPFDNDDSLDDEYVVPVKLLTSAIIAPNYGIPTDIDAQVERSKKMIRKILREFTGTGTTRFTNF